MLKFGLIFLIYCTTVCYAVRQQITFYTGLNCTAEGLILQSKQSNLNPEAPRIISSYQSTLTMGVWQVHSEVNFTNIRDGIGGFEHPYCQNKAVSWPVKSARYRGPPDTQTSSLSLYEETAWRGREVVITGPAFVNIPFIPKSIMTTGTTSWTFYTGDNFNGNATCFIPKLEFGWYDFLHSLNDTMSNVRSILRDCNCHINKIVYGDNEKESF